MNPKPIVIHMLLDQETWVYDFKARLAWHYSWHQWSQDIWSPSTTVQTVRQFEMMTKKKKESATL